MTHFGHHKLLFHDPWTRRTSNIKVQLKIFFITISSKEYLDITWQRDSWIKFYEEQEQFRLLWIRVRMHARAWRLKMLSLLDGLRLAVETIVSHHRHNDSITD